MPQQRETVTDRLANVIQVIQLGRKTGQLSVERGEDRVYEEGYISFVNGQIVQATTGQRYGAEALNWLNSWGESRFTFIYATSTSMRTTASLPALPAPAVTPTSQPLPLAQPTQPLPNVAKSVTAGKTGGLSRTPQTQPLPRIPAQGTRATGTDVPVPAQPNEVSPAPYRTRQPDEALRLLESRGLSRTHRHLLLLTDGQRTITELARLIGRSQDEVRQLMRDLEEASLIRQR